MGYLLAKDFDFELREGFAVHKLLDLLVHCFDFLVSGRDGSVTCLRHPRFNDFKPALLFQPNYYYILTAMDNNSKLPLHVCVTGAAG